jgi:hypothetical protein
VYVCVVFISRFTWKEGKKGEVGLAIAKEFPLLISLRSVCGAQTDSRVMCSSAWFL